MIKYIFFSFLILQLVSKTFNNEELIILIKEYINN